MNDARRKEIERAKALLDEARNIIEAAQSDEHDNMPDSLQSGERGEKAQEAADALQEACDAIEEVTNHCDTATGA